MADKKYQKVRGRLLNYRAEKEYEEELAKTAKRMSEGTKLGMSVDSKHFERWWDSDKN